MSNATGPFGLRPIRHRNGAPWNGAVVPCRIGSGYGTALYIGDPVLLATEKDYQDTIPTMMSVIQSAGTVGTIVLGAIVGFDALPANLTQIYNPASTERIAYVAMGPDVVFEIRGDGSGTWDAGWVGATAAMVNAGGSTITGLSGFALDESTPSATQNNALHIVGVSSRSDNEAAIYSMFEVVLNTSLNATGDSLGVLST